MRPKELRRRIKQLDANTPRYRALEVALGEGVGFGAAWYGSQKEHWMGWLKEYDGAGAYGRRIDPSRDARYVYNHIQCAPMLFWLAEALGFSDDELDDVFGAVIAAPNKNASQCAALRKMLPWDAVNEKLMAKTNASIWFRIRQKMFRQELPL